MFWGVACLPKASGNVFFTPISRLVRSGSFWSVYEAGRHSTMQGRCKMTLQTQTRKFATKPQVSEFFDEAKGDALNALEMSVALEKLNFLKLRCVQQLDSCCV